MKYIKKNVLISIISAVIIAIAGCKSPEVVSDWVDHNDIEESVIAARQDTVKAQSHTGGTQPVDTSVEETVEYFTVQVGAYENTENAEQVYRIAQQRFNRETINEFDAFDGLYKITVGKFSNYDQARTFRDRIMREFAGEYYDAWVVGVTQREQR